MLFVESILLFQVDFGYADNLVSHVNSYPFLNFWLLIVSAGYLVCIVLFASVCVFLWSIHKG